MQSNIRIIKEMETAQNHFSQNNIRMSCLISLPTYCLAIKFSGDSTLQHAEINQFVNILKVVISSLSFHPKFHQNTILTYLLPANQELNILYDLERRF